MISRGTLRTLPQAPEISRSSTSSLNFRVAIWGSDMLGPLRTYNPSMFTSYRGRVGAEAVASGTVETAGLTRTPGAGAAATLGGSGAVAVAGTLEGSGVVAVAGTEVSEHGSV